MITAPQLAGFRALSQLVPSRLRMRLVVAATATDTMTFLAAQCHDQADEPWLIDGPIDRPSFPSVCHPRAYAQAKRHVIKLFLLPNSNPDLNPIEKFFAKLKQWLRGRRIRTLDTGLPRITVKPLPRWPRTKRPAWTVNYRQPLAQAAKKPTRPSTTIASTMPASWLLSV